VRASVKGEDFLTANAVAGMRKLPQTSIRIDSVPVRCGALSSRSRRSSCKHRQEHASTRVSKDEEEVSDAGADISA
jgi:hypothetical protein